MNAIRNTLAAAVLGTAGLLPLHAHAADACALEISGTDQMQYDKKELSVPASCKEVTLTLHHTGKFPKAAMGHNWVLVAGPDLTAVDSAAAGVGIAADYVPNDKRVLAHTKLVGGGESTTVKFSTAGLKAGGDYKYLCTFPGHAALMHGVFKFG
ncbi:MAG: azurin [Proteobacteria bacterium]|nr:azurin [Pseudomonadota bacterium]